MMDKCSTGGRRKEGVDTSGCWLYNRTVLSSFLEFLTNDQWWFQFSSFLRKLLSLRFIESLQWSLGSVPATSMTLQHSFVHPNFGTNTVNEMFCMCLISLEILTLKRL